MEKKYYETHTWGRRRSRKIAQQINDLFLAFKHQKCVSVGLFAFATFLLFSSQLGPSVWNLNTKKCFFCYFLKSFERNPRDRYRWQQNRTFFHSLTWKPCVKLHKKRLMSVTSKLSWAHVWHTKLLNLWNYNRCGRNWWRSHIKSHKFNMKEMLNSLHIHTRLTYKIGDYLKRKLRTIAQIAIKEMRLFSQVAITYELRSIYVAVRNVWTFGVL